MRSKQTSFAGGEQSPVMLGRMDDARYQSGLSLCRNFVCLPQGPAQNRSGFEFVRAAKYSDTPCRLIEFTFSTAQTMVIELGDKYARFHTQGATLLNEQGQPYEIETPYAAADLFEINYVQSSDVMTFVHPKYAPRELRRYGATDWRLSLIDFGAPLKAPAGLSGTYECNAKSEVVTDAMKKMFTIKYVVTAIKDTDAGTAESPASLPADVVGNLYLEASKVTLTWNQLEGAKRYRVYKTYSGVYGYIGETEETTFVDDNVEADEGVSPPRYDDPFYQSKGIVSVEVTNGGAGYSHHHNGVKAPADTSKATRTRVISGIFTWGWWSEAGNGVDRYNDKVMVDDNKPLAERPYPAWYAEETNRAPEAERCKRSAAKYIELVDLDGKGTGATFEPILEAETGSYESSVGGDSGGYEWVHWVEVRLRGFRITSPGQNYGRPVIRAYCANPYKRNDKWRTACYEYALTPEQIGARAYIQDATGSGAVLEPVVSGGRIASINVITGGSGYSDPKVVIDNGGAGGSGATATASTGQAGDYPGAVSYFEQRRVFGGTLQRPHFVWMTRPGTESDMSYTLPSKDDNRIKFRIASADASRIRHIVPMSSLLLMSASTEFRVTTANDDAITPASVGVRAQSYVGSAAAAPILVNSNVVFVANRGGHVRELGYNYSAGGFVTGDISLRASHLFNGRTIRQLAQAKAPEPVIWAVSSDGKLLGCTYVPEQQVCGWHQHDTVNGSFESVACVAEGDEDILYAVIRRTIGGKVVRYIERMHERLIDKIDDSFFVDSGLSYFGEAVTTLKGLEHLEGETVSILADGAVAPQQVVKDGSIKLNTPARTVRVGLPITAELQTLPIPYNPREGAGGNVNVRAVSVRVYQASGFQAGYDEEHLATYPSRTNEPYGSPPRLRSEELDLTTTPRWDRDGQVLIRQDHPLPLTVCSITTDFAT